MNQRCIPVPVSLSRMPARPQMPEMPCDTYTFDPIRNQYTFAYRGRIVLISGDCQPIRESLAFIAMRIDRAIAAEQEA